MIININNFSFKHLYSQTTNLNKLSLSLKKGNGLLLTGSSGSGKSTVLGALAGLIPNYFKGELSGQIEVAGLDPLNSDLINLSQKIALMTQNPETQFFASTVYEEIYLTLKCKGFNNEECKKLIQKQVELFKLEDIINSSTYKLSEGQKQKVVLASLSALNPKLLLLDEPTANLDPKSIEGLREHLLLLKNQGVSLVIADHRLHWLDGLCEDALVMKNGSILWQGAFDQLTEDCCNNLNLRSKKLPEIKDLKSPPLDFQSGFFVENLEFLYPSGRKIFKNFSFSLPINKVTVLTGSSGLGKTTLARILAGFEKPNSGKVYLYDKNITWKKLSTYCSVVLQNADHQLYMPTVVEDLNLSKRLLGKSDENAENILKHFALDALKYRHPQSLSGGEKQRLVVAISACEDNKLLILDEPTSGLDGQNLNLMAKHINSLKNTNKAILVITHDLQLISLCADYILNITGEE